MRKEQRDISRTLSILDVGNGPYIGSVKQEGHLDHNYTVLEIPLVSHLTGFVVNEVDVCTRLIDPADEEVAPEHILIVVILEIGFGIQVGCEGIDDPGGSDV